MKKSKYVKVKLNFLKNTDIITGDKIENTKLIDERFVAGKIIKEDKYSNSKYKFKVRTYPNVCRWYKASEIIYM